MVWIITDDIIIYYDGVCAWLLYGPIGSPSHCETLIPLDWEPDYGKYDKESRR